MTGLAGAVVWGVVPYVPQAPFRIYAGTAAEPFEIDSPAKLIDAARSGGDPDMTYLVTSKARPVLVLSDTTHGPIDECLVLRLARFSKLTDVEIESVRDQQHPAFFHLHPERFAHMEECAAMIAGLVRVHRSALDRRVVGRLEANELAVVHERFVRFHGFDLRMLVKERIEQLAAAQRARRAGA